MTQPYLIAHVVRGLPAFDIAEQVVCPLCQSYEPAQSECDECDQSGHWWIIPTSGHRAYPYWHEALISTLQQAFDEQYIIKGQAGLVYDGDPYIPSPPLGWPDHYQTLAAPRTDLISALGLNQRPQQLAIKRRKV